MDVFKLIFINYKLFIFVVIAKLV